MLGAILTQCHKAWLVKTVILVLDLMQMRPRKESKFKAAKPVWRALLQTSAMLRPKLVFLTQCISSSSRLSGDCPIPPTVMGTPHITSPPRTPHTPGKSLSSLCKLGVLKSPTIQGEDSPPGPSTLWSSSCYFTMT